MIRTIEDWMDILKDLRGNEAAKRIFGDIIHYHEGRANELSDRQQLANALEAWHKLRTAEDMREGII